MNADVRLQNLELRPAPPFAGDFTEIVLSENLPDQMQEVIRRYISEHGGDSFALPRIDPERFAMLLHDTRRVLFEGGVNKPKTPQEFILARQMLEFLETNLQNIGRVYPGKAQSIRDLLLGLERAQMRSQNEIQMRGSRLRIPPPIMPRREDSIASLGN